MSDDTPTQKFEAPGTDAPTEVIGGPPTPPAGTPATASGDAEKSRRLMIILIAIGSALVLILLLLLILLLTRGSGDPTPAPTPTETSSASPTPSVTPSPTPSATPSPTPTPTPTQTVAPPPPPPPPSPITTFTASDTTVNCDGESSVPVTFSWAATGQTLWFGVGTDNAKNEPYSEFPLNYTFDFDYQCGQPDGQQKYTITVQSSGGSVTSKTIIIKE